MHMALLTTIEDFEEVTMGKNNRFQLQHAMAALLTFAALPVWATDAALLEVLLKNKLISKQQYEILKDAQIR
ncbi:MAG: hypothetical protein ACREXY_22680, partial [Gammaproteobacteria bacterium]